MSNVFSLMDFIPVYRCFETEKTDECPEKTNNDWVRNLEEIGKIGENLVKEFLETQYNAIVKKQPDYKGYDFKVEMNKITLAVEVKTSYGEYNHFYMSYNEIRKAKELAEYYNLYYVCLDDTKRSLFVMNNPYEVLGLEKVFNVMETNEVVSMKIEEIELSIKDYSGFTIINNFSN